MVRAIIAGNPILAIGHHPEGSHPLIESDGRILEDRTYLERELLLAGIAIPNLASLDEGMLLPTTPRASDYPIGPAKVEGILESAVFVGEENYRLLQCFRAFHDSNLRPNSLCVKCIITLVKYS